MSILNALWPRRTAEPVAAMEIRPGESPASAVAEPPGPFRTLVESLPDPVLVIEGDPSEPAARRIIFANSAARVLFPIRVEGVRLLTAPTAATPP